MQARINGTSQLEARPGAVLISAKAWGGAAMTLVRRSVSDEGSHGAPSGGGEGIGAASIGMLWRRFYHFGPPAQPILQAFPLSRWQAGELISRSEEHTS